MSRPPFHDQTGFTLIEAIMVIVITGILGAIVAVFMRSPIQGYLSTVQRADLTDAADAALRRLARDVRAALPNSLRVTQSGGKNYIEFIYTSGGGRYRDPADGSTGGDFLSFTDASDLSFHVVGKTTNNATDPDYIAANDFIVVYNIGADDASRPGNAYYRDNRASVSSVSCAATPCTVTMYTNPYAIETPPLPSPSQRFQIVPLATMAVTFVCPTASAGDFQRYAGYGFNDTLATTIGALGFFTPARLAERATCVVEYSPAANGRNGLLYVQLTLRTSDGSESVQLFQAIHVDNTP